LLATLTSAGAEGTGWNAVVRDDLVYTDITRDVDNVTLTITLRARPTFSITATETITVGAIPAGCVTGGVAIDVNDSFNIYDIPVASSGGWSGLNATGLMIK